MSSRSWCRAGLCKTSWALSLGDCRDPLLCWLCRHDLLLWWPSRLRFWALDLPAMCIKGVSPSVEC